MSRISVTEVILAINVLVFAAMVARGVNVVEPKIDDLIDWGANFGPNTLSGEWWRLVTSMFLHVGFIHLAFNMWFLWNIGPLLESFVGKWCWILVYFVSGIVGSIASVWWNPRNVSAGASGALFGMMGALYVLTNAHYVGISKSMLKKLNTNLSGLIITNLLIGMVIPRIDASAHLGGLIGGGLCGLILRQRFSKDVLRQRFFQNLSVFVIAVVGLPTLVVLLPKPPADIGSAKAIALMRLADESLKKNDFDEAILKYDQVIQISPMLAPAYANRGVAWANKGKLDQSIADLNEAIRLSPTISDIYRVRGDVFSDRHEYEKALADFAEAIRLEPNIAAYERKAWLLATCPDERFRDGTEAVKVATRACELSDWNQSQPIVTLGVAFAETGDFTSAVAQLKKALAMDSIDVEMRTHLLAAFEAKKRFSELISK